MAYGDTCGKWKMCFPQVQLVCDDCVADAVGSKVVIDFNGDGPTTNCGIFGAPFIKLTSTKNTGTIAATGNPSQVNWTLGTDPITTDIIWPEAQQEGTGFNTFYSRVPLIEYFEALCGVDGGGNPVISFVINMGIAQSPDYTTSGSPPPIDQWSVITNSSYNLDYNISGDPYNGCDADYTATGTTPSTVWSYTGTLPINLSNTI